MKKDETFYEQLKDKNWLYKKYILEKLSLSQIQKIIDAKSSNSVRQALIRHQIPVRKTSEGLTRNNEICYLNQEIIDGCLLGDAGLNKYNKSSDNSYPFFYKKNKYLDHIEYVAKFFYKNYKNYIKLENTKLNNKIFPINIFTTKSNKDFLPYFKRWYPENNNFGKIIPKDLNITPLLLLNWFMDDGSTSYRRRIYKGKNQIRKKQIRLIFCTNCFSLDDQEYLCDIINNKYNLKAKPSPCKNTYVIKIPQSKVCDFYEIIGKSPVQSMNYKWK